ncbi:MAG: MFS transporter [Gammaproteobacteria bacterium]|nr:MFS transporter [Gammaproteobacteria bacterium]
MSTIVVVRKNNQACIAADTLTTFGDLKLTAARDRFHEKIQISNTSFFGIVGSAAHSLVMDDVISEGEITLDLTSRHAIFQSFLKLHSVLKDHYFLNPKGEDNDPYESSQIDALIANPSGIFGVFGLRDVNEFTQFWAIGSGADYALGAMHVLYDQLESAEAIALAGAAAGAAFDNASGLPLTHRVITLAGN